MRALIIYCHPVHDSFCAAMRDAAVIGLHKAGHHVDVIDLAAENFNPVMSKSEWNNYFDTPEVVPDDISAHVALVRDADTLIYVYPTWWSGLPAQLKGWVERTMILGVAFDLNKNNKIRPSLGRVKRIFALSTFGSPRLYVWAVHNNGRRILFRSLRWQKKLIRMKSMSLYSMDTQTHEKRQEFLARITKKMASL